MDLTLTKYSNPSIINLLN